ncbi:hypothetical protein ACFSPU_06630 [Haoranjiania flava]|uniref:Uncharacterized protein n=1 Tax=Haoranjiania flava TaxID=1856322 RepID=A0AAE3IKZ2_9BACT|nr:hypothetical protein [Haoranjiania flava]MCU7694147.1 hypothetical protein [Haoranjiania flava]
MKNLKISALAILVSGALLFTATDAQAQNRGNGHKAKNNKVYAQKNRDHDMYDRNGRYGRNDRYHRRSIRYGTNTDLPPGQAKKVYGGKATDYAPGQLNKNEGTRYDRRSRTVWDDIFGTRRR